MIRFLSMAVIPLQQAFEIIQAYSMMELALKAGMVAGVVHHFTCHVPKQVDVLIALLFWTAGNVLIIVASLWFQRQSDLVAGVMIFNAVYVSPIETRIDAKVSVALISKAVYNVCFRHRGIPTKFAISLTDWGLWGYSTGGYSHLKISELHHELGSVSKVLC